MSGRSRSETTRVLRRVLAFLEQVTDEEFEGFARGSLNLELTRPRNTSTETSSRNGAVDDALITALKATQTRDAALEILRSAKRPKSELTQLARYLKVHVDKQDKVDGIEEKLIENIIGARLRSEAIQGVSFKGTGNDPGPSPGEGEMEQETSTRSVKGSPRGRNGVERTRLMGGDDRDELRDRLVRLSNQLFTTTRENDWWIRRFETEIPEMVERVSDALAAFPESEELKRSARVLLARLDRAQDATAHRRRLDAEQTQSVASALNDVAGALMRVPHAR